MNQKPPAKKGIKRICAAFVYSLNGFRFAISNEVAFQQELAIIVIAIISLFFLPLPFMCKGLLFLSATIILVVETLNSAIETIVNLVSPEYHILAKHAKDLASAAVFLSIIIAVVLWSVSIFYYIFNDPTI